MTRILSLIVERRPSLVAHYDFEPCFTSKSEDWYAKRFKRKQRRQLRLKAKQTLRNRLSLILLV